MALKGIRGEGTGERLVVSLRERLTRGEGLTAHQRVGELSGLLGLVRRLTC